MNAATLLQGLTYGTHFYSSVQGVQHEAGAWAENYGFIQKVVALPPWKKLHTHLQRAAQGLNASVDSCAHWAAWTWHFSLRLCLVRCVLGPQ